MGPLSPRSWLSDEREQHPGARSSLKRPPRDRKRLIQKALRRRAVFALGRGEVVPVPVIRTPTRTLIPASPTDADLLRCIAEGDLAALGDLYDRYVVDMWRAVSLALGATSGTEDVVHAVFLNLPRIAASYDGRVNCRPWLLGIAVRLAMRHSRGVRRFRRILCSLSEIVIRSVSSDLAASVRDRGELAGFERALAGLSAKKRAAFVLADLEGLTCKEVATALEVPAAAARTILFHARRDLHAAVKRAEGS